MAFGGELRALRGQVDQAARHLDDVSPARLSVLTTRGVAGVEPYVTRYLPALVPATVLPVVTLAAITWLDPLSGLVVALTLLGFATLLFGLVVLMPLVGHASWHAYRDLVE